MNLVWLDLCSGLGGASQPALDRGWRVIRVDIDPRFKPDIVADVRALPLKPFHVDVLWASPPCQDFSKHGLRCFFPDPPSPDMTVVEGVALAISRMYPRFWVVENVWASRPFLTKLFGPVRIRVPGHVLWSNLAFLLPNLPPHKGSLGYWKPGRWGAIGHGPKSDRGKRWGDHRNGKLVDADANEAAKAAKIPYEIGEAICRAVEQRNDIR